MSDQDAQPQDRSVAVIHLRQGHGPNADSQIKITSQLSPEDLAVQLGAVPRSPNPAAGEFGWHGDLITFRGRDGRHLLVAREHVAWIEVGPLTERELRRLREDRQLLEGVR